MGAKEPARERLHQATDNIKARVSAWNIANYLTIFRIVLVPILAYLLLRHSGQNDLDRYLAFTVFAAASITDQIDGYLARSWGLETDFGRIMDPIADKFLIGVTLIILSWLGILPWVATVIILCREIGVTVMRFVLIRREVIAASQGGKIKTFLQTITTGLLILPLVGIPLQIVLWLMVPTVLVTVFTGLDYAWRGWRLWKQSV